MSGKGNSEKPGSVRGRIKQWSQDKHHDSILEAIAQEAAKRQLDLSGHVSLDIGFRDYVDCLFPLLNNGNQFNWHPHNCVIASVLEDVLAGLRTRVMLWLPPRCAKSTLVQYFSAYYLSHHPDRWVGLSSYNQDLADTLSKVGKRCYTAAGYPLSPDSKAVAYWETGRGGGMWSAGTDGAQLGKGYSLGIIDDPTKSDAFVDSPAAMERLYRWYSGTFSTRKNIYAGVRPAVIVVQQRLGNYDLSGWLLSRPSPEPWHIVCCEAIKEELPPEIPENCTLEPDWREVGEFLVTQGEDGVLFSEQVNEKRTSDPFTYYSLYQQRPTQAVGQRVDAANFKYVLSNSVPKLKYVCRAWDTQVSKSSRDWTVGVQMGIDDNNDMYVLDVIRYRGDATEVYELIVQTALADGDDVVIAIEEAAISKQTIQELKKEDRLGTFQFKPIKVDSAKGNLDKRSAALFSRIRNGQVHLVEAGWNPKFVDEFVKFSGSRNDTDDQVSACTVGMSATYSRRGSSIEQKRPPYNSPAWAALVRREEEEYSSPRLW